MTHFYLTDHVNLSAYHVHLIWLFQMTLAPNSPATATSSVPWDMRRMIMVVKYVSAAYPSSVDLWPAERPAPMAMCKSTDASNYFLLDMFSYTPTQMTVVRYVFVAGDGPTSIP